MNIRKLSGALTMAAVLFTAGRAQAIDNIGTAGAVVGVEISEVGSDEYAVAKGRLFIDEGGVIQVYPRQGTACSGRVINDQQIDILVEDDVEEGPRDPVLEARGRRRPLPRRLYRCAVSEAGSSGYSLSNRRMRAKPPEVTRERT